MKIEIDTKEKVCQWLMKPVPAVFQGQDLRQVSAEIAAKPLTGCVFLGCRMEAALIEAAANAGCFVIPWQADLLFDPFTPGLYTPDELFDKLAQGGSYDQCLDRRVYLSYMDSSTQQPLPADVDLVLMRRVHDASISEALEDLLDAETQLRTVAIMGGHDIPRNKPIYNEVAQLGLALVKSGFMVLTGGGPGLMEAGNLGAYCAGFDNPQRKLSETIEKLKVAPTYKDKNWLSVAYQAWKEMGEPSDKAKSRNVGIPTWFYGHEPPNVFATDIAKYFENSVREEGLLAIALGGIIFAEGNAGTVQEIFQDACQNYYRTYAKKKSPMVLFGFDYWSPSGQVRHIPQDPRKNVYSALEKLSTAKGFNDYILLTDDVPEIIEFFKNHPPS